MSELNKNENENEEENSKKKKGELESAGGMAMKSLQNLLQTITGRDTAAVGLGALVSAVMAVMAGLALCTKYWANAIASDKVKGENRNLRSKLDTQKKASEKLEDTVKEFKKLQNEVLSPLLSAYNTACAEALLKEGKYTEENGKRFLNDDGKKYVADRVRDIYKSQGLEKYENMILGKEENGRFQNIQNMFNSLIDATKEYNNKHPDTAINIANISNMKGNEEFNDIFVNKFIEKNKSVVHDFVQETLKKSKREQPEEQENPGQNLQNPIQGERQ